MRNIIIILIIVIAASCSQKTIPVVVNTKDSTKQESTRIERVVEKQLVPDSASIKALIKCDSLGNAYLSTITQLQGERVNQVINLQKVAKDLLLDIKSKDKAKETQKETITKDSLIKYKEKPVPYKVEVPVNYVTGWQWFQIWLGRALVLIYVILITWNQIRNKGIDFKKLLNAIKIKLN